MCVLNLRRSNAHHYSALRGGKRERDKKEEAEKKLEKGRRKKIKKE